LIYAGLAVALYIVLTDVGPRVSHGPRIKSWGNLSKIGLAIRDYAKANGSPPGRLSDLVPGYVTSNQIGIFYVTNFSANEVPIPADWPSNALRIDDWGAYFYLGTNTQSGVLAFERTNLWKPRGPYQGKVAVLFSDFHVQEIEISNLQELLGSAHPPSKSKGSGR
jgi:hypothetical protein